jgi:hypothetical protein
MVFSNAEGITPGGAGEEDGEAAHSSESSSQDGFSSSGSLDESECERILGALRTWANFSVSFAGGMIGQSISEAEEELADQQDSVEWYEQDIKRAQAAQEWHQAKAAKIRRRLEILRERLNSIPTPPEG